jgi:hypothetical protein
MKPQPQSIQKPRPQSLDGAEPAGTMVLTGVVRTTKGYAVARAVIARDGNVTVTLGHSQTHKEFVAIEHKRSLTAATLKA